MLYIGDHEEDEAPYNEGDCVFSLSRWDKTRFNLDVRYPMSIMSAFGFALSIFDLK